MGMIDTSRKLILSALSATAIAFSGCSSGTVESNYLCDQNGCHPVSSATDQTHPSSSSSFSSSGKSLETTITDATGRTTLFNQQLSITDEKQQPLPNIKVYGLNNGQQQFYLAVDPAGEHYPEAVSQHNGNLESHLETGAAKPGSQHNSNGIIDLILKTIDYSKKIIATFGNTDQGDFIRGSNDVNLYCMTLEQMKTSYILVPAGIIFLTTPEGIAGKTVKIANTAALNQIFDAYIKTMYGNEDGYLVAVPQTAIDLCGEEYDGVVCPITSESLSDALWSKRNIPVWEIRGSCTPSSATATPLTPAPSTDPQNNSNNNTSDNSPFYDYSSGLQWQKMASASMMTKAKADNYCNADNSYSNWRLPQQKELTTIMTGSGECLLAPQLKGSCNWYWASDEICNDAQNPFLQVNFSPTDNYDREACAYGGEEAYVRCVRKL